jgi:hypothetical protein
MQDDGDRWSLRPRKSKNERMKLAMKAILIHQHGGPEVLPQVEMQRPAPGANEVLIKVHAASVNPFDWKARAGYVKELFPLTFPATLGSDVSGTVEEVGPGVARFKRGDEVYASLGLEGGGYAEYAVAKEASPDGAGGIADGGCGFVTCPAPALALPQTFRRSREKCPETLGLAPSGNGDGKRNHQFLIHNSMRTLETIHITT